jgi:peroxiredoxin family protein
MHFLGLGRTMMQREMKKKNIMPLVDLVENARSMGATFHCCETSALIFGWTQEELANDESFEVCGAVSMLAISQRSDSTLFI